MRGAGTINEMFATSAVTGLVVLGALGLYVAPSSGESATHASSTTEVPFASTPSSTVVNVCSAKQPAGYALRRAASLANERV